MQLMVQKKMVPTCRQMRFRRPSSGAMLHTVSRLRLIETAEIFRNVRQKQKASRKASRTTVAPHLRLLVNLVLQRSPVNIRRGLS
jgi:hypothetical protein